MKPVATDQMNELRQQLILAQVRVLELEDIKDDTQTRVGELTGLLAELQSKADQALGDFDHLQGIHQEMLKHRDHLQHLLHLANQSLTETRNQVQQQAHDLAAAADRESESRNRIMALNDHVIALGGQISQLTERSHDLDRQLAELHPIAAARLVRLNELDSQLRALKTSRSWRWTAWLRSLERALHRR